MGGGSGGEASLMGWEKSENTKPDNVIQVRIFLLVRKYLTRFYQKPFKSLSF